MSIETLKIALGWSTILNWGILALWFALFACAHDWMYRLHGRWFKLTTSHFDAIHYAAMAAYKVLIIFFNLTPYLALRLAD